MVIPTTASAAEATPEISGTLGWWARQRHPPGGVALPVGHRRGLEYLSSTVIALSVRRLPAPTSPGGCSMRHPHTESAAAPLSLAGISAARCPAEGSSCETGRGAELGEQARHREGPGQS